MSLGDHARRIDAAIAAACRGAVVALALAIFALMLMGIAGRHVLSQGLPAVTELPEQLFPWLVMASIVLAAQRGAHVSVEALSARAGAAWQRRLAFIAHALTFALCLVLVWTVVRVSLIAGGDRSPILGIPTAHLFAALSIGFTLMSVLALCSLVRLSSNDAAVAERAA